MTIEDFAKVYDFIGKDRGCFAILEKLYEDKDEFETIRGELVKEIFLYSDFLKWEEKRKNK